MTKELIWLLYFFSQQLVLNNFTILGVKPIRFVQ